MSTLEVRPPAQEVVYEVDQRTPAELLRSIELAAKPGQFELQSETIKALSMLTARYISLEGERVEAEFDRYNGVRDRSLNLDTDSVSEYLCDKKILVTGGTGLIGSELLSQLTEYQTGNLTSISRGVTLPYRVLPEVQYITGVDIRNKPMIEQVVDRIQPDIIFHVAADKYNHEAEKRAPHTLSVNIIGLKNVIDTAEQTGVEQIVYASTGKASRPFSPDIYASSKKAGEWLMSRAVAKGGLIGSAVRFTHVVDDSNIKKKINERINTGEPVMLQGPDVWMYMQSAHESAQLLLNAGLEAKRGDFRVQAIRDLGIPVNLADLGFGAIAKRRAQVPVYFQGAIIGYEEKAWPLLFGPDAGDRSPLINSIETYTAVPSESCPEIDTFTLDFDDSKTANKELMELEETCYSHSPTIDIRDNNLALSWAMLDARLARVPAEVLSRLAGTIRRGRDHFDFSPEDRTVNGAVMRADRKMRAKNRKQPTITMS